MHVLFCKISCDLQMLNEQNAIIYNNELCVCTSPQFGQLYKMNASILSHSF